MKWWKNVRSWAKKRGSLCSSFPGHRMQSENLAQLFPIRFFLFGYNFGNNFAQSFAIRHSQISFELKYIFVSMCFCVPMGIKSQHLKFIALEIKILFPTECHFKYRNISNNISSSRVFS